VEVESDLKSVVLNGASKMEKCDCCGFACGEHTTWCWNHPKNVEQKKMDDQGPPCLYVMEQLIGPNKNQKWEPMNIVVTERRLIQNILDSYSSTIIRKRRRIGKYVRVNEIKSAKERY